MLDLLCHHRLVIGPVQLEGLQRVSHRHVWRDEPAYIDRVVLNNLVLYQDFTQKSRGARSHMSQFAILWLQIILQICKLFHGYLELSGYRYKRSREKSHQTRVVNYSR